MRLARLFAPGQVQLVQVRFTNALTQTEQLPEFKQLLDSIAQWLGHYAKANELALHAWALTPKRLLLLTTGPDGRAVSRAIQAIGRRLAAELKTGSVFEGRYKSALISPDWVLRAQIWLESVPVDDGYATQPAAWPWSSASGHVGMSDVPWQKTMALSDHERYWACGNTPFDRQAIYRTKLNEGLSAIERQRIGSAVLGQWALGSEQYLAQIAAVASRRVVPGKRGRPPKKPGIDKEGSKEKS